MEPRCSGDVSSFCSVNDTNHEMDALTNKNEVVLKQEKQNQIENMKELLSKMVLKQCSVEELCSQLKPVMSETPTDWILPSDEESKNKLLMKLQEDLKSTINCLEKDKMNTARVLENTNAVNGTYLSKVSTDWLKPRRQLVKVRENVMFKNPTMTQNDETILFDDLSMKNVFNKALELNGLKFASNLKSIFAVTGLILGYDDQRTRQTETIKQENKLKSFCCKTTYSIVPVVLWEPHINDLDLTDEVMIALTRVEELLSLEKIDLAVENTMTFFNTYGSHFYCGNVHLGGTFKVETKYENEETDNKSDTKDMVQNLHAAFWNTCLNVPTFFSGSFDTDKQNITGNLHNMYTSDKVTKVQYSISKFGGPTEVDSLALWKKGLVQNNSSWVLIDAWNPTIEDNQLSTNDFIGIWNLISQIEGARKVFKDATVFSKFLMQTWQQKSEFTAEREKHLTQVIFSETEDLKNFINESASAELIPKTCANIFSYLYKLVQCIGKKIPKNDIWREQLRRNESVHFLLNQVVTLEFTDIEEYETKDNIKKLLENASHVDFPGKGDLIHWIHKDDNSQQNDLVNTDVVNNIEDFVTFVRDIISDEDNEILQRHIAAFIHKLLKKYLVEKDDIQYIRFVALLIMLEYNAVTEELRCKLTKQLLEDFIDNYDKTYEEFNVHCHDKHTVYAFVFYNLLSNIMFIVNKRADTVAYKNTPILRLQEIQAHLEQKFPTLEEITRKYLAKKDIQVILNILRQAIDGTKDDGKWKISWDYFENYTEDVSYFLSKKSAPIECKSPDHVECKNDENEIRLKRILQYFSFDQFYPAKITVQKCLTICDNLNKHTSHLEKKNIPWIILRNIMSLNYTFRDHILHDFFMHEKMKRTPSNDEDISSSDDDSSVSSEEDEDNILCHPSDVQLAIYCCCDPFLKKMIAVKTFQCQLAIPLMYPTFTANDLVFSTWPLTDIVLHGYIEPVSFQNMYHICFLKFGNHLKVSKSKIINEYMRDLNEQHATFIHRDCELGNTRRNITKGIVEISWYVPNIKRREGNSGDTFCREKVRQNENLTSHSQTPISLLNLRGNASEFVYQTKLLCELSHIVVVFISNEDLKDMESKKSLIELHQKMVSTIVVIETKTLKRTYRSEMKTTKKRTKFLVLWKKTSCEVKQKLCKNINRFLEKSGEKKCLRQIIKKLPQGFISDENYLCLKGNELAENLISQLKTCDSVENWKDTYLPLQGQNYWQEIGRKTKLLKQAKTNVFDSDKLEMEIKELRLKQTSAINNAPTLLADFVRHLIENCDNLEQINFFLSWLKQKLDTNSRKLSLELLTQYDTAFAIHEASNADDDEILYHIDSKLTQSSFGLEHIFREVGQIYEAFIYANDDNKHSITQKTLQVLEFLPHIMAKLTLLGYPIELMDGDAACVQIKWVTTVIKEIKSMIGEKPMITISVLGIQSSGKSTLLNSMFGLQFAVGPGRCTRGIYLQLIPINKTQSNLNCDYLLVIDTEGLRTPEKRGDNIHHDNELATFVIGLADIVVLNFKGETITDMEAIMQIVIAGLLRLKQANKDIKLNQSSIFIHQNIAEDAHLQLLKGNVQIVQNLDTMTKDIARHLNIANISRFSDVIAFKPSQAIKYVPDLLHGSLPMSPISKSYSTAVMNIREWVLQHMSQHIQPLTLTNFTLHFQNLWQGILADDFVFSFRNILEIKAYSLLESEYQTLKWKMEDSKIEWMNNNIKNSLVKFENKHEIVQCSKRLNEQFLKLINDRFREADNKLVNFVNRSDLKQHMLHYLNRYRFHLQHNRDELKQDVRQVIEDEKTLLLSHIANDKHLTEKTKRIHKKARDLAKEFSGTKPSNQNIEIKFEQIWVESLNELAPEVPRPVILEKLEVIKNDIKQALYGMYSQHTSLIGREIELNDIDRGEDFNHLYDSFTVKDIESDHFSLALFEWLKTGTVDKFKPNKKGEHKKQIIVILNTLFREIDLEFSLLFQKDVNYDRSQITTILKVINISFKNFNSRSANFTLSQKLEACVAVHVARHSFCKFKKLTNLYEEKHGLRAHLQERKSKIYKMFKDTCKRQADDIIAANCFCEEIRALLEEKIKRDLPLKIHRDVLPSFNHRKHNLMKRMLEDLAESDTFFQYFMYISNPESFAKEWLTNITNTIVFKKDNDGSSSYTRWLHEKIATLVESIKFAAKFATTKSCNENANIMYWLKCFREQLRDSDIALLITKDSFRDIEEHCIQNFDDFVLNVVQALSDIESQLIEKNTDKNPSDLFLKNTSPYENIFNFLWGCTEKCPWCGEPCQRSDRNHGSSDDCHTCIQHRPNGIGGVHNLLTGFVSIESCNFKVQSKATLKCDSWCNCLTKDDSVFHPYKLYKNYIEDWEIKPSSDMSLSKYWNWFIANNIEQLASFYCCQAPNIPVTWISLSKHDAVTSLNEVFLG